MADEDDGGERSEDPTQKRLDDALERGDVAKSQEVNTWFMIAGATLVLSTFSGSIGGIQTPLRNLIANSWMIRTDGRGSSDAGETPGICGVCRHRRADPDADAGGDRRQHAATPAGLVGRIAEAQVLEDFADGRRQAHLRQAGGGQFRQGPVQAGGARRRDDGDPVAASGTAWSRCCGSIRRRCSA